MFSLPHPLEERAMNVVKVLRKFLAYEILGSPHCWQPDGLSFLGHRGYPGDKVASPGITVNSVICCGILTHVCRKIQQWRIDKWPQKVLVLHDNAILAAKQHRHWHPSDSLSYHIHHSH